MSSIPYVPTGKTLTFFVQGASHTIHADSANYAKVRALLQGPDDKVDVDSLIGLTIPIKVIQQAAKADTAKTGTSRVTVENGEVRYHGAKINDVLATRMLDLLDEGWDLAPWFAFVENLYANPSEFARDELYEWLEKSDLPITPDGHFLAYKRVNHNFTSVHDGRTDNSVGKIVSLPREKVDADRRKHCSTGLHFCSAGYLGSFSGAKVVLLKINPADVVSIPDDYSFTKGRAWRYEVVADISDRNNGTDKWPAVVADYSAQDDADEIDEELEAELAAELEEAEDEARFAAAAADEAQDVADEAAQNLRDYKAEYAARIARGKRKGWTKQQAAGHG